VHTLFRGHFIMIVIKTFKNGPVSFVSSLCAFTTHTPATHCVLHSTLYEYWPARQSVHAAVPVLVLVLYIRATHSAHAPALGPVSPVLQMQLASVPLTAVDCEFTYKLF